MRCSECYWCTISSVSSEEVVCSNEKSKEYKQSFSKQEIETKGCDEGETRQAVDYRNMTPWQFASKYYM